MATRTPRSFDDELDWAVRTYFGHRPEDIADAKRIIAEKIESGEAAGHYDAIDLVNQHLLGNRSRDYLSIRAWAIAVLRDPGRIGTMSTGERLAMALMFERPEWLRGDSYAGAAERVGPGLVRAIVQVEADLRWMEPPMVTRPKSATQ